MRTSVWIPIIHGSIWLYCWQHSPFQGGGELGMRRERKGMLGLAGKTASVGNTAVVVVEDTRHSAVISIFMSMDVHSYTSVHTNIYFPHTHVHTLPTPLGFQYSCYLCFQGYTSLLNNFEIILNILPLKF